MKTAFGGLCALALWAGCAAECPNACSSHGECRVHDECHCYQNYQANDCSERTCYFGIAHVDSPKGDLNHDGVISGPLTTVLTGSEVYPWGTTEQFPNADANEGHFYMECSNKGLCNRQTGICECFEGYTGTACARAACPNDCSGHGTCESIRELAEMRHFDTNKNHAETSRVSGSANHHHYDGNVEESYSYDLWDADKSMACKCDPGYWGADCSMRKCAYGVDPLFYDNEGAQYQTTVVHLGSTGANRGAISGTFKIVFYDVFGEQYVTKPIDANPATASAEKVRLALQALPNQVIANKPNHDVTGIEPNNVKVSMQSASGIPGTEGYATYGGGAEGDAGAGLGTQGKVTADACSGGDATDNCAQYTTKAACDAGSCVNGGSGAVDAGCTAGLKCTHTTATHAAYGVEFTIEFTNNPGVLRSMEADTQGINNPGSTDYWVANYREGQFTTRFATTLGRVNTLMYGSKLLYTNNMASATNLAPTNSMIQVGGSQYRVTSATSYILTLSEPWLGASILPILIETGATASALTLQSTATCSGGDATDNCAQHTTQAACDAGSCVNGGTGAVAAGCTAGNKCTFTAAAALSPQEMTVSGVSTPIIADSLMAGSQLMTNDCPFISEQGGAPSNDIAQGETTLYVLAGNDCHSFSGASHIIYRRNDDANNMHVYSTGVDTASALTGTVIAQRGSSDIYFAENVVSNAGGGSAQQFVASYVASTKTFTFATAGVGEVSAADTLHWVNGLGPMKAAAVADAANDIVMDPDATTFFDTDFSTANTQFPIYKEKTGTDAGVVTGSILLLNGRRYKVTSRTGTGSKLTLNEVFAGGELRRLCTACVNAVAAAGTSITLAAGKRVTVSAGDRVLVSGYLNEDLQATVSADCTDDTTISLSAGSFRGTPANIVGRSEDADFSAAPLDLYVLSNGVLQSVSSITEGVATTFQYVAQCSNRGFCNAETGLCECYAGYSNHNCNTQNMLAM